jgi:oxygen-independent coproporphyrinogen-3 oxidase
MSVSFDIKDVDLNKNNLLEKYNIPVPRYTSYPTVPYWEKQTINKDNWKLSVKNSFDKTNKKNGIAIYIHLPYCESICTFCGCNKRITKNHDVESPYIQTVLKEWEIYQDIFKEKPIIKELHLGGGTPTFFSSNSLKTLIEGILKNSELSPEHEFSLEVHPNVTNEEQIKTLYELGFRRISIGVQDFDPYVQTMINRVQSFEQVKFVNDTARKVGFTSINFDLVYGLPFQKEESIINTVNKVKELMPDRIAFYSYAHVPWKSPGQRRYTENDLPSADYKRKLYETGRSLLENNGYIEIGMDHFALKSDKLFKAMQNKSMHRNFMGYTDNYTELLIGLGVSSISDTWSAFMQNNKVIEEYTELINSGNLPISEGHILTDEDMILRRHILNLMCNFKTEFKDSELEYNFFSDGIKRMSELEKDGLVEIEKNKITVTEIGKTFVRNICMALDNRLWSKIPSSQLFSKAI